MATVMEMRRSHGRDQVKRRVDWIAYGYLSPALVTICVLSILPIFYTIYISLTDFNQMHFLSYQFVGLKNYEELLNPHDPLSNLFMPTFIWTLVYALCTTALSYLVGLILAVLLNNKHMKERTLYRTLLIVPWAVPNLISMLAWQGLLNDQYGQINALLHGLFGLPRIPWLTSALWARIAVIMVNVWAGFPYMMTVCLGALQSIPTDQYEAAEIDGANWWQVFRYVTMPSVWRISLPLLIPSFSYNFNNFNASYLLTGGGPPNSNNPFLGQTDILATAAYKMTLTFNRYDLGATISVLLFILVALISWVQMRYTGAFKEVDA
ncbi:carbohydrate ABC transporter permease [Alicyclobacillus mali (ex Roth et al. 2021)]|uniref:carbohydrate ABC transporter permease n=1 Tax=Alicyclobacillus mali (ex Roth et al. 2021) TaxID=1123961 RepID=UPI0009E71EA0|nr:sugar ABC transporter permease [Alicyclobacillus mali (ex Roth et al. 2021)]